MTELNEILSNIDNLNANNSCYHWNRPLNIDDNDNINIIGNFMYQIYNDRWTFCSNYSGVHVFFSNVHNNFGCVYNIRHNPEHNPLHPQTEECIICYSDIDINRIILPCDHTFHQSCIEIWLQTCRSSFNPLTCPTCRRLIL